MRTPFYAWDSNWVKQRPRALLAVGDRVFGQDIVFQVLERSGQTPGRDDMNEMVDDPADQRCSVLNESRDAA